VGCCLVLLCVLFLFCFFGCVVFGVVFVFGWCVFFVGWGVGGGGGGGGG